MSLTLYLAGFMAAVVAVAVAYFAYKSYEAKQETAELLAAAEDSGEPVALKPAGVRDSMLGLFAMWRHHRKAKRLAEKGYVRWFRQGSTMRRPTWVKPERKGAGVPEYEHDGQTYLFPEDSMVIDARTGAYMAIHHEGEATPVPIKNPELPALDGDRLQEVINLEMESSPPSWLDGLDIDSGTLVMVGIGLLFIVFAAFRMMG